MMPLQEMNHAGDARHRQGTGGVVLAAALAGLSVLAYRNRGRLRDHVPGRRRESRQVTVCVGCLNAKRGPCDWRLLDGFVESTPGTSVAHALCPPCAAEILRELGEQPAGETTLHSAGSAAW